MFNVKITTVEEPSKYSPCKKKYIEELIGASPDYVCEYISKEVLEVPEKKWASIEDYWEECWKPYSYSDCFYGKDDPWIATMFKNLSEAYEFWVEEKTGEALKSWFDSSSPSFEISYENISVVVTREAD